MDPSEFIEGDVDVFSLASYLYSGTLRKNKEDICQASEQGRKLFKMYGVIPERETTAKCPECHENLETIKDKARHGFRYICRNHERNRRFSPYQNTCLSKVRADMGADKVVALIFLWLIKIPVTLAMEHLHLAKETAINWYSFCRDVACAITWHDYIPIGGQADIVEVNKHFLFEEEHNVVGNNERKQTWIVGGISRTTKKVFAVIVQHQNVESFMPILKKCIDHNSYVCTDNSREYNECTEVFKGHGSIKPSRNFISPPKGEQPNWAPPGRFNLECLDHNWSQSPPRADMQPYRDYMVNINRCWRDLKSNLRTTHNPLIAEQYVGEWMYRKNILGELNNEKARFEKFLRDIARAYPGVGKKPMKHRYGEIDDCDCHICSI